MARSRRLSSSTKRRSVARPAQGNSRQPARGKAVVWNAATRVPSPPVGIPNNR